jgi:hypothetical protein
VIFSQGGGGWVPTSYQHPVAMYEYAARVKKLHDHNCARDNAQLVILTAIVEKCVPLWSNFWHYTPNGMTLFFTRVVMYNATRVWLLLWSCCCCCCCGVIYRKTAVFANFYPISPLFSSRSLGHQLALSRLHMASKRSLVHQK